MVKEFFQRIGFFKGSDNYQPQSKIVIHQQQLGSTGTESFSGYPQEEYLQALVGRRRADEFDKIRRSDPQAKMCLSAVKSPIKSANWEVAPFDENDPDSVQDAKLIEFILFEGMAKTFKQFLNEALTLLDHGHSVFEVVDKVIFNHPEFGTINAIDNLAFRSQRTIERWNLDVDTNKLKSISQYAFGDLQKLVDIPAEFLLVLSLDKEGSNYEGISALRAVYGNWFRKNQYLKLNAIGIEKFAIPTPLIEVPNGKEGSDAFNFLVEALEKYQTHESNYLTFPEGWKITLNSNTYDPQKVEVSIDNEDKRMVKSFMANFLELGMNGFGSQSLSFDLSDFFLSSIEHVADIITEEMNRFIIPRYVQMNRGERKGYPYLKVTGISDRVGKEFAMMMKDFADSKMITPDDSLEAHLRKRFNLPDMSKIGQRVVTPTQSAVPALAEKMRLMRRG